MTVEDHDEGAALTNFVLECELLGMEFGGLKTALVGITVVQACMQHPEWAQALSRLITESQSKYAEPNELRDDTQANIKRLVDAARIEVRS